jgi:hypothetical protein
MFKEIIHVYSEKYTKSTNTEMYELLFLKQVGHIITTGLLMVVDVAAAVVHVDGVKKSLNCNHQRDYCSSLSLYMST